MNLTVVDGFKFGCGFVMSIIAFCLVVVILASAFFVVATLVGLPLTQLALDPANNAAVSR